MKSKEYSDGGILKNDLFMFFSIQKNRVFLTLICIISLLWSLSGFGFSDTYFYELYLHNEYYSEPPGFPNRFGVMPLISSFTNKGHDWWEKRFSIGTVESLRLTYNHAWIEFIGAIGQEHVRFNHQGHRGEKKRFGCDDFLIDVGYNFLLDRKGKMQIILHWLTGIPLHWKVSLAEQEEPLFGTRTFAMGPVIECAYDFIRNQERDLFIGFLGRFLHRFKRTYEPILPSNAVYNPGNVIDLMTLIHYRYYGHNFECGYVPTFLINSSYELPKGIQNLSSQQLNSVYFDYFYYHDQLSMGFETNLVKTFGKNSQGISWYGAISWYF